MPRPRRRKRSSCVGTATNATAVTVARRSSTRENPRAAAVTDADFPRVLNGPAPGYAEDALRRLVLGSLPREGGSLTEIGFASASVGRAQRNAVTFNRGGGVCGGIGGSGGDGGGGAMFPCIFHDEGVSSSLSSSSWQSDGGGAHGSAGNALGGVAGNALGGVAGDVAGDAAAADGQLEAGWTLGWRTGGHRRAAGLSGAERLHGGASLLQQEQEEEEVRFDESQHQQHVDGRPIGHLSGHANGYIGDLSHDHTSDHGQAPHRRPNQAFSSAASVAQEDDWEALILDQEAEGEGDQGTKKKEPLPYSTLWSMQLKREEQSHQEACDKYSKVTR